MEQATTASDERFGVKHVWIAAGGYLLLTLLVFWPLGRHVTTHVPHDLGDPLMSAWILWWNAHVVPFTTTWWNGLNFFPAPGALAYSDHRIGLSLIASPIQWLGGNHLLAYNITFLLSFALSALAMHVLVFRLTHRHTAAVLAAAIYAFSAYRMDHTEHIEIISSYWMPLALLGLHEWMRTRAWKWLAVFGVCWLLQSLACGYYMFYFAVFVALWSLWFLRGPSYIRDLAIVAATMLVSALPLVPILWQYKVFHDALQLQRTLHEIELYSADVTGLLSGSPWLSMWSPIAALRKHEGQMFPGLIALAIVVLAAVRVWPARRASAWPMLRWTCLALAVVLLAVAFIAALAGDWRWTLGPLSLSVGRPYKPLTLGLLGLCLYAATSPALIDAYRRRSAFAFYVLATVMMWVLAFGPSPRFLGYRVFYKAPYAWLMTLPGFDHSLRAPARFTMLATMALAVAAGIGLTRLLTQRSAAASAVIATALAVGVIVEILPARPAVLEVPPQPRLPSVDRSRTTAVLELPLGYHLDDYHALYHTIEHRLPVVNGTSGYEPPHYSMLRLALDHEDDRVVPLLAGYASLVIMIDARKDPEGRWTAFAERHARFLGRSATYTFYQVARTAPAPRPARGTPLPIQRVSSNSAPELLANAHDGQAGTWWESAADQAGGEEVTIELPAGADVCGVTLSPGPLVMGVPRGLTIDVSSDGAAWRQAWTGMTASFAMQAALDHPSNVELTIDIPRASGVRAVRLVQSGQDDHPWAIGELAVLGCAS